MSAGDPSPGRDRHGSSRAGEAWSEQRRALGEFIRSQRRLARLSLRQLSALSNISNPYLSQVERGLHVPSVRVLDALAQALDISAETLLTQAGLVRAHAQGQAGTSHDLGGGDSERALRADPRLSEAQKEALIAVYRSYVSDPGRS